MFSLPLSCLSVSLPLNCTPAWWQSILFLSLKETYILNLMYKYIYCVLKGLILSSCDHDLKLILCFFHYLWSVSWFWLPHHIMKIIPTCPCCPSGVVRLASQWPLTYRHVPRLLWTRSSLRTTGRGRSQTTLSAAPVRTTRLVPTDTRT